LPHQQQRQPHARKHHEDERREEENWNRQQTGEDQKRPANHAPAAQNTRYIYREPRAIARALPVISLHFAPQVTEHERAWRHHQEPQKAQAVRQAAAQHGARYQMHQRQDDDLLVVSRSTARGQAHHLQRGRELDGQRQQVLTGKQTRRLQGE
jgi:hypothetical protein